MLKRVINKTTEKATMTIDGKAFPIIIHREWRQSVRFSLGKKGAIIRMPTVLTKAQQQDQLEKLRVWVQQQLSEKDSLKQRFFGKNYKTGDILKVGERTYTLKIEYENKQRHSAKLKGREIQLSLSKKDSELHLQKAIKHLLSRIIAKDFLPAITARVKELNEQFFQKEISNVKLKYNLTNWGSCSSKTNINLSTRLLFAPQKVVDYVIIHELAHLIEMNHSEQYWAIVKKAMPDFKTHEKWLRTNGHLCDF